MNVKVAAWWLLIGMFLMPVIPGVTQGIKGQDTRRHVVSITKPDVGIPDESGAAGAGRGRMNERGEKRKTVYLVGQKPFSQADAEVLAAMEFVRGLEGYTAEYHTFIEFTKRPRLIREADLIWFHRADTSDFTAGERDPKVLRLLREYVSSGGGLLLSLDAFRYITTLGVECIPPGIRSKSCVDEGYGRKLGFHGYRNHPLFTGLNGGAYVYKPQRDLTVRVNGFFGDTVPEQGKVVAIDWDYIFFREHTRLIAEYQIGTGKILAVGAYTLFSVPNDHRMHLERFTWNAMDYITGKEAGEPVRHWNYSSPSVDPCFIQPQVSTAHPIAIPPAAFWQLPDDPMAFPLHPGSADYCEAAGERILILAQERAGIEEVWSHPFMALRDYRSGIRDPGSDSITWLSNLVPEVEIRTDGFLRRYRIDGGILTEMVVADPEKSCGVIHYEWIGTDNLELAISFTSNLRLMWPYPATCTGSLCYGRDETTGAVYIQAPADDLVVFIGGNRDPDSSFMAPGEGYSLDAGATYLLAPGQALDVVVAAGSEGFQEVHTLFAETICNPGSIVSRATHRVANVVAERLMITSPDSGFNAGYRWALAGTDRFFVTTPGMGSALVAGYGTTRRGWDGAQQVSGRPGYAWYFGRDGQWSGFALLDYGDFDKVRQTLEFFLRYQDLTGKILHEATTSGVVHYDAADATPLFIVLAGKYFRHSGDTLFLQKNWPAIKKSITFCLSTDTDGDHLIENTHVGHGWVEGGQLYGSHSTFYLTGCWAAALDESASMAEVVGDPDWELYRQELKTLKNLIDRRFWNSQRQFYAYGVNQDGTQRTETTILPAVPAYFGVTERLRTRFMLDQWASNAFSTNWGTRIIREDSPLFNPTGYHYGSVWPLFTGWTALAEYRHGNYLQGFTHILNNMNISRQWALGFIEEVMNGAEYWPSGVCPHQCWSETMVLQPVIEGMLGLEIFSHRQTLRLAPRLPAGWDSLTVTGIRAGDQFLTMQFVRDSLAMRWKFAISPPAAVTLEFIPAMPPGTRIRNVLVDGVEHPFATFTDSRCITLQLTLLLEDSCGVSVEYEGGMSVLPMFPSPVPGDRAAGMRIIDARMKETTYSIVLEGLSGTCDTLGVWSYFPVEVVDEGAEILSRNGQITDVVVRFGEGDAIYQRKTINLITRRVR